MYRMYKRFNLRLRNDGQDSYQIKEQQNSDYIYDAYLSLFSPEAHARADAATHREEEGGTKTREAGVWV